MAAFMERLDCKLADDDESDEKSDDSKASLMTDTEKSAINCYVLIQACSSYRYHLNLWWEFQIMADWINWIEFSFIGMRWSAPW